MVDDAPVNDPLSSDLASLRINRDENPERGSGWRRAAASLVVVGALGAAAAWGYPRLRASVFKTEVGVSEIAMVSPVQSSIQVTATGYVVPQTISKVSAKIQGRVSRILIKEGDTVKAGQVIAELDAADQRSAIVAAASRVAVARARVDTAKATLAEVTQKVERQQRLVATGAEAKATLEDLVAQQASLREQVAAAEAEVKAAQADGNTLSVGMGDRVIKTPIDGTVIAKPIEAGELVGPMAAPIAEIADFASLLAEVDVPENRLHLVQIGGPCEVVLDAYPDKRFRGHVVELGKRVDRSKATVKVKVKLDGDASLALPDMSARVSFLREALSEDALAQAPKKIVPVAAVVDRDGKKVVFVVESDVVRVVPVTVGGAVGGGALELVDGPASGTRVVTDPPPEMTAGQKIKERG